jgi:hypothetical protein
MITEKLNLEYISDIAKDALKPMSIMAIKEKFLLSFPFKVRRVRDSCGAGSFSGVTTISTIEYRMSQRRGWGYGTNNFYFKDGKKHGQSAELEDYILEEAP